MTAVLHFNFRYVLNKKKKKKKKEKENAICFFSTTRKHIILIFNFNFTWMSVCLALLRIDNIHLNLNQGHYNTIAYKLFRKLRDFKILKSKVFTNTRIQPVLVK